MNREEYIKKLIKNKGMSIKDFAKNINMPYSTLLSILNGSIGGAAVDNVIKICRGLSISVSDLQEHNVKNDLILTNNEIELVLAYRNNPSMQEAVNRLLGVNKSVENCNCEIAGDISGVLKMADNVNQNIKQR